MSTKTIRIINVPESDLDRLSAVATALGTSKQEVYRLALNNFWANNGHLVEEGLAIQKKQAELRKE